MEPVQVGQVLPGTEPLELPEKHVYARCGHCNGDGILGDPKPETWLRGLLDPGQSMRFAVIHDCYTCELPTVVTWTAVRGPDGFADLTESVQSPFPASPALNIQEYKGTAIDVYYTEAWRCRRAGLRRAAMVMARATLQACYRRYLTPDEHASYTVEMKKVAELAGSGWAAIGKGVRDFGNQWAHPEGGTAPPSWAEVQESFRRMQSVLAFTAEMERVGHITPAGRGGKPGGP